MATSGNYRLCQIPSGPRVAGTATGLVCTSFVDVVLSRYVDDGPEDQLDSYKFGEGTNIFDAYGLALSATQVRPAQLRTVAIDPGKVYGVVFHMRNAWTKKPRQGGVRKMKAGSRMHVGFAAFHSNKLFLVHASGRRGVHIVAWDVFLQRKADELEDFAIEGPKFLSVYEVPAG